VKHRRGMSSLRPRINRRSNKTLDFDVTPDHREFYSFWLKAHIPPSAPTFVGVRDQIPQAIAVHPTR
jgi:hypothetical protein